VFSAEIAECIWEQEPGHCCWKFRRVGDLCLIEVFRNNEAQAIFSGDDDLVRFGLQVAKMLQKLLNEWGADGYLKQWGYAFPKEARLKLERAIETERICATVRVSRVRPMYKQMPVALVPHCAFKGVRP
jgi:hypothetical protein